MCDMAEKEQEENKEMNEEEAKKERERLDELGVSSTWDILTSKEKKKKEEEKEKPAFRGFK